MDVPAAIPETSPVPALTVALPGSLLLQAPPPVPLLLSAVVEPTHTEVVPLIVPALGTAVTVTRAVVLLEQLPAVTV